MTPSSRRRALTPVALAVFVAFLDVTIVNIAFPSIERSFDESSRARLSWVLNGYNVVFAALLVPAARGGDRYGHARLFRAGLVLFTLASALCAVAPTLEALVAARVLQATGAALIVPSALAVILPLFGPSSRAGAVAVLGGAAAVAAAAGPSLGGLLIEAGDWRLVFLVNLPLGLAALGLSRRLPELRPEWDAPWPDLVGVVLLIVGVGAVALGLVQTDEWGWGDARCLVALGLGATSLVWFAARARRHPAPALDVRLLTSRLTGLANLATLVFALAFYAKILCDVLYMTTVWGYSTLTAGLALTPGPVFTALFAVPAGRLTERYGFRASALPGVLLYGIACGWQIAFVGHDPAYVAEWLPSTVMTGLAAALALPTLTAAAVTEIPSRLYGSASAANATARQLGAVLGIALLVPILESAPSADPTAVYDRGWLLSVAAVAVAAGAIAALRRGGAREGEPAPTRAS